MSDFFIFNPSKKCIFKFDRDENSGSKHATYGSKQHMHYMVYVLFFCVRFVNEVLFSKFLRFFFSKLNSVTWRKSRSSLKKSPKKGLCYMCSTNDTIKESEDESQLVILN